MIHDATGRQRLTRRPGRPCPALHGASYSGDGAEMLRSLAAAYEERFSDVAFATNPGRVADVAGG
ncbi:MAG: hypothetical protein ABR592_11505 [Nitriliruptorales bacterium]